MTSKLNIASMPGTMASSGLDGSFLLPLIRDVLSNEFVSKDVKHNNFVFHPKVREQLVEMVAWALDV